MSYDQDVLNELDNLRTLLEENHKTALDILKKSEKTIDNLLGDYGAEERSEAFDEGYDLGFQVALKKGKLDSDDYKHYKEKETEKLMNAK